MPDRSDQPGHNAAGGCHEGAKTCRSKGAALSGRSAVLTTTMSNSTHLNGSDKLFYSVSDLAVMFDMSTKSVYRLLKRGVLRSSSALRRKLIPRASVVKFIEDSLKGGDR